MNEPTIDNLFSVVAPRPDLSQSVASRRNDDTGGFDDQLRQAGYSEPLSPPVPQWRPPAQRQNADGRRPDVSAPPSPRSQPASQPSANQSPATDTASGPDNAHVVTKRDKRDKHDSNQSPADTGAAANTAQAVNKPASDQSSPDKSGPDKSGLDKNSGGQVANGSKSSADQSDRANLEKSATDQAVSASVEPTAAAAQDDSATSSTMGSSVPQPEVPIVANDQVRQSPSADTKTDSHKLDVAAKLNETATPASASVTTAAVVANEQTATATDKPAPDAKSPPGKTASDRGLSAENASPQSTAQIEQPAAKQLAAGQPASAGSNSVEPSTQAVALSASTSAVKSDAKAKDQTPVADPSAAAPPSPTEVTRANANQPTPAVAAITTPTTVATASQIDGAADAKAIKSSATLKSTNLSAFARFDREGLLTSAGPRQAGESQDTPTIDPARFVGRVVRAIETAQERGGPINLRLSPPELGSMRIELSLKDGVMNAKVETETASARQALLDNLPALRDKLANQNVRIERFDVDVRRDAQGDQSNSGPEQRQFQQQQQYNQSRSTRPATAATGGLEGIAPEATTAIRTITDTTINLVA